MANNTQKVIAVVDRVVRLAILLTVVFVVLRCIDSCGQDSGIEIKDTPVAINSIRPIGEFYAFTAITEDYAITSEEEVGFFTKRNYKFVQTLRMKVSYVMNLDSVEYLRKEGSDTVIMRLPRLRYVQTGQGGYLLGEAEIAAFDAADAIETVERKIRSRYDQKTYYDKAMLHAREVLATFVSQCGLVPVFEEK